MKSGLLCTLLLTIIVFASCSKEPDSGVYIRIDNQSSKRLSNIVVPSLGTDRITGVNISYGSVAPHLSSTIKDTKTPGIFQV